MSVDLSIRPITIKEQACAAARRFIETGEPQDNPHHDGPDAIEWKRRYEIAILRLSALAETQASA